jgi:hypothetical protein
MESQLQLEAALVDNPADNQSESAAQTTGSNKDHLDK